MYRYTAPLRDSAIASVPEKCRPIVRFRREKFGWLAAFPDGKLAMLNSEAEELLLGGASYDECRAYLVVNLEVETTFAFSAPLMAWLELTRGCNLRCPHCFVEGGAARSAELSTRRILKLLEEWASMGVFSVVITGGEPTIHPDFLDIVLYAHSLGFAVSIATNGMAMTDKMLSQIPQDDVIISVSLDGIHGQGDAHNETDFDYVTRKLLSIRQSGFNSSIMTTTTRENIPYLESIIQWAINNDISLRSVPFVPMGRGALHRELMNTTVDVETAAQFWIAEEKWERIKDKKLGLCSGKIFNFLLTMVFSTHRCMSGRGVCYVNSGGDVYPCSTCSGAKVLSGGNLMMSSFPEIWDNEEWQIRQITWKNFEETCKNCPINAERYFCTGRCPGSSAVLNNDFYGCGTTEFQRRSILRREELFRADVRAEARVFASEAVKEQPRARKETEST